MNNKSKNKLNCKLYSCTPVIPATQKVEAGTSQSEEGPSKSVRPYLKNKLKQKGMGVWVR
jgi:hypothetical protein